MASSNRHWPSLFKSKPCSNTHQWQHEINSSASLLSPPCHKPNPYTSGLGITEERSPEPKPRWNPKPEQIRILEAIFNSGMVNPPRDEIRKIRAQLQEYGHVGDANVFYWFQNRKSRSKHKQRHLHSSSQKSRAASAPAPLSPAAVPLAAATSSSSSSDERSDASDKILPLVSVGFTGMMDAPAMASPTGSFNRSYFQSPPAMEFLVDPVYSQGELSGFVAVPDLWTEMMMGQDQGFKSGEVEVSKARVFQNPNPNFSNPSVAAGPGRSATTTIDTVAGSVYEIQGGGGGGGHGGGARVTVFINGVGFEVMAGPFNVREVFGVEAVLIHASGHPVLTDEWGLTLHPLQHGASYYLI